MLEATAAKTAVEKKAVQAKIAEIRIDMGKSGNKPVEDPPKKPPVKPPVKPPTNNVGQGSPAFLEKGFVDFMVLGPLPTNTKVQSWTAIKPRTDTGLPNFKKGLQNAKWRRLYTSADRGMVDYSNKAGTGRTGGICFYAVATITTAAQTDARIHVTHDDGMTVWLNRETVYQKPSRDVNKSVDVTLQKGRNVVITRAYNVGDGFSFSFALTDRKNAALPASVKIGYPK